MKRMKRVFAFLIIGVLCISIFYSCGSNLGSSLGLEYTLNQDKNSYSVSVGNADDKGIAALYCKIVIPSEYDGTPVTNIKNFTSRAITNVVIRDGVSSIESRAFSGCVYLSQITIPQSIKSIGNHAFTGCIWLSRVTLSDGLLYIGDSAFSGCSHLKEINIPDSVIEIGSNVFSGCTRLKTIKYSGTMEQWNSIEQGNGLDYNAEKYTVYCIDGKIKK